MTSITSIALTLALGATHAMAQDSAPIKQDADQLIAGTHRAICYSGFRSGQHPDRGEGAINPSDAEILEDLEILSKDCGFTLIRLYDSKVNSAAVLKLIEAHKLDLKVLLGAWLDAEISNPNCPWQKEPYPDSKLLTNKEQNNKEIERAIRLAKQYPEIIVAVAVGNEALVEWNDHMVPEKAVIDYVRKVKTSIPQPVTVADNYDWWIKHGARLAKEVDFISVHIYPVWEGKNIDEAMPYSIANMQAVRNALPDSQLVITEAGWATTATEFGNRACEQSQARYFHDILEWSRDMNITTFFFEAFDEDWKGDPGSPLGAEKHWGIFKIDRSPKEVLKPKGR